MSSGFACGKTVTECLVLGNGITRPQLVNKNITKISIIRFRSTEIERWNKFSSFFSVTAQC